MDFGNREQAEIANSTQTWKSAKVVTRLVISGVSCLAWFLTSSVTLGWLLKGYDNGDTAVS